MTVRLFVLFVEASKTQVYSGVFKVVSSCSKSQALRNINQARGVHTLKRSGAELGKDRNQGIFLRQVSRAASHTFEDK